MSKEIKLFTNGVVENKDRKFTRLVGGFGDDSPIMTTKQIAELMGYDNKIVNKTINRNISSFEVGVDILDIKNSVPEWNSLNEILKNEGYSKQSISNSKNIYLLSKSGFLLYLKFAEGEKAVEIYKDFLEDYFQTRAENEHMKKSIQGVLDDLQQERAILIGKTVIAKNETERLEAIQLLENKNKQIIELEKSLSEEELIKKLESKLHIGEVIENSKSDYDIGTFAKILNIQGMGRNKMFEWLRNEKILMENKIPYQQYMKYFTVIPVTKNNITNNKPLIKSHGIDFVVKRLIKSGKVITKSSKDILNELEATC